MAHLYPIPPQNNTVHTRSAVQDTRFSPKIGPKCCLTEAPSGDRCRFKKSSGPTARATGDGRADVLEDSYSPRTSRTSPQALPSLLDAPPSLTAPLAQLACATPASTLRMAGAACPEPALGWRAFPACSPRCPDSCPCTLPRSARCPNPLSRSAGNVGY
jgi:hypothetical protein